MKRTILGLAIGLASFAAEARQACFYEHAHYQGRSFCMGVGEFYRNLDWGFSSRISSITVDPGARVTACIGRDFTHQCMNFENDVDNLHFLNFYDAINSIEVRRAGWGPGGNRPPARPPRPPHHPGPPNQPPQQPPHSQPPHSSGPVARVITQVNVGCKGRVEQITIDKLNLDRQDGYYLYFKGSKGLQHKCGNNGWISSYVEVAVPRQYAYMNSAGELLMPASNARVICEAKTSWVNGGASVPCMSAYLSQ